MGLMVLDAPLVIAELGRHAHILPLIVSTWAGPWEGPYLVSEQERRPPGCRRLYYPSIMWSKARDRPQSEASHLPGRRAVLSASHVGIHTNILQVPARMECQCICIVSMTSRCLTLLGSIGRSTWTLSRSCQLEAEMRAVEGSVPKRVVRNVCIAGALYQVHYL